MQNLDVINIGTVANDGTGDPARTVGTKINQNNTKIKTAVDAAEAALAALAPVATTGAYNSLSGRPNLAPVATSGSHTDLTNIPNFLIID